MNPMTSFDILISCYQVHYLTLIPKLERFNKPLTLSLSLQKQYKYIATKRMLLLQHSLSLKSTPT